MPITPGSVHVPSAMNNLSIRGRGKKWQNLSISDIMDYSKDKSISFVEAYRLLTSTLYSSKEINA